MVDDKLLQRRQRGVDSKVEETENNAVEGHMEEQAKAMHSREPEIYDMAYTPRASPSY